MIKHVQSFIMIAALHYFRFIVGLRIVFGSLSLLLVSSMAELISIPNAISTVLLPIDIKKSAYFV